MVMMSKVSLLLKIATLKMRTKEDCWNSGTSIKRHSTCSWSVRKAWKQKTNRHQSAFSFSSHLPKTIDSQIFLTTPKRQPFAFSNPSKKSKNTRFSKPLKNWKVLRSWLIGKFPMLYDCFCGAIHYRISPVNITVWYANASGEPCALPLLNFNKQVGILVFSQLNVCNMILYRIGFPKKCSAKRRIQNRSDTQLVMVNTLLFLKRLKGLTESAKNRPD